MRARSIGGAGPACALGLLALAACAHAPMTAEAGCDRACLISLTEDYLAAMVAHAPGDAPVAEDVKFTENTHPMALGEGAWAAVTGVRDYKVYATDPEAGEVALYTVIDEAAGPALLTLRLKVEDRKITEVESVHVAPGGSGLDGADNLVEAAPAWSEVVPPEKRRSRAEMIAITDRYLETLEKNLKDYIPFSDDCLRVENGVQTAGVEGAEGLAGTSCHDNLNNPIWAYIGAVNPRRYLVVDEEHGLVSGMFMFRHDGMHPTYVNDAGETVEMPEAMMRKQAVVISEIFKIEDGEITRIEAVMKGRLPLEAPSGWEE